jgi:hypothetical protein
MAPGHVHAADRRPVPRLRCAYLRFLAAGFDGVRLCRPVVFIGRETVSRSWVEFEIEESSDRGNALLGVRTLCFGESHRAADRRVHGREVRRAGVGRSGNAPARLGAIRDHVLGRDRARRSSAAPTRLVARKRQRSKPSSRARPLQDHTGTTLDDLIGQGHLTTCDRRPLRIGRRTSPAEPASPRAAQTSRTEAGALRVKRPGHQNSVHRSRGGRVISPVWNEHPERGTILPTPASRMRRQPTRPDGVRGCGILLASAFGHAQIFRRVAGPGGRGVRLLGAPDGSSGRRSQRPVPIRRCAHR